MVTEVFTDGACLGNPGPGGWAFVVDGGPWASGAEADSTNQRMELLAVRCLYDEPRMNVLNNERVVKHQ